jgi:hypothetical protein
VQRYKRNPEMRTLCRIVRSGTRSSKCFEGFKMEVLETMKAARFNVVDNKAIDQNSKKLRYKCFC